MKENEVREVYYYSVFMLHRYMHNKDDYAIGHVIDYY